ncbi:GntR family transcriptional regulator [Prauserella marina]|uniref:DNA-binding transcriptional regulator YhcF, GntR family n=1 Tax=Prauserella marina TaxID=530584 RepID=A0A222VK55_9PSEU|nr:GntR family transcriptional regulator [Prauserella marina]ASR34287.1 GntR family transcriptional regulator [Prauserella marina]PWV71936.1 GntR family transcriptional regulator [Prauserella marina]SDD91353.1 DNA-binding transcriptional regulator YhcF, GntR family [Prauserella marina]
MIVTVDATSKVPPYEQVRAGFAERINDGGLAAGTKLPTVRALAADLGIAPNTIARAYRELEEAGLIETRGRAGSFVSSAGEENRAKAVEAAKRYAETVRGLGIPAAEAVAIVAAAVEASDNP